jgi:hypothetical protein
VATILNFVCSVYSVGGGGVGGVGGASVRKFTGDARSSIKKIYLSSISNGKVTFTGCKFLRYLARLYVQCFSRGSVRNCTMYSMPLKYYYLKLCRSSVILAIISRLLFVFTAIIRKIGTDLKR